MKPGYIYAIQNAAYGTHLIKIGLTTRAPEVRSKELYSGATGVPLEFDIAVAYSVGDCEEAEKRLHKRLKAFRLNNRREFFRVSPSVASAVILETCADLNEELSLPKPEKYPIIRRKETKIYIDSVCEPAEIHAAVIDWASPSSLKESPIGTSNLSHEQKDRIKIIFMMLDRIFQVLFTIGWKHSPEIVILRQRSRYGRASLEP